MNDAVLTALRRARVPLNHSRSIPYILTIIGVYTRSRALSSISLSHEKSDMVGRASDRPPGLQSPALRTWWSRFGY
jgi:hypothetical protein